VRNEEVSQRVKGKSYILQTIKEGKVTGYVASCIRVPSKAHYCRNDIRKKLRENKEKDISSYWTTIRKREHTGN